MKTPMFAGETLIPAKHGETWWNMVKHGETWWNPEGPDQDTGLPGSSFVLPGAAAVAVVASLLRCHQWTPSCELPRRRPFWRRDAGSETGWQVNLPVKNNWVYQLCSLGGTEIWNWIQPKNGEDDGGNQHGGSSVICKVLSQAGGAGKSLDAWTPLFHLPISAACGVIGQRWPSFEMYVDRGVETLPFLRNQSKNNPTWFDQFCWGCPVLTWTYENLMTVRVEGPEPIIWTPHDPTSLPQKNYDCLSLPPCADTNPIKISAVLDGIPFTSWLRMW